MGGSEGHTPPAGQERCSVPHILLYRQPAALSRGHRTVRVQLRLDKLVILLATHPWRRARWGECRVLPRQGHRALQKAGTLRHACAGPVGRAARVVAAYRRAPCALQWVATTVVPWRVRRWGNRRRPRRGRWWGSGRGGTSWRHIGVARAWRRRRVPLPRNRFVVLPIRAQRKGRAARPAHPIHPLSVPCHGTGAAWGHRPPATRWTPGSACAVP